MSTPTDKQIQFLKTLCAQRTQALATERWAHLLAGDINTARDASRIIDTLLKQVPVDINETPEYLALKADVEALRAVLSTLSGRDRDFAESLISQFDRSGRLSEKQVPHVKRLAAGTPTTTVEEGVYVLEDGTLITVYTTKRGFLAGKVWNGSAWEYTSGAQRRAADGRKITAEEAAAFGHATGCCVFCARDLTDDRSVQVGYGPVCAQKHSLPWGLVPA